LPLVDRESGHGGQRRPVRVVGSKRHYEKPRYRHLRKASGRFPTEQAALSRLHMITRSLSTKDS